MAGEWLKFDCSLPEKPEVLAITVVMGWDDPDMTVGKLMRLFRWFDQHTIDGNARGVTAALLDRIVGVTGFVQAVADVGWLLIEPGALSLHNFDRHNGATAKGRAQTAKRVANHKANAKGNADTVSDALPREEKRREEKKEDKGEGADAPRRPKASRKCPEDFDLTDEMREWAAGAVPSVDVRRETDKFRDHTFKTAHSDWLGAWRNWLRRAQESAPARRSTGETDWQRSQRERMQQFAPGVAAKPPGQQPHNVIDLEIFDVPSIASS